MNYNRITSATLALALSSTLQCSSPAEPTIPPPDRSPAELTLTERRVIASTNDFGFELFDRVNSVTPSDSNLFISPLSVAYALGMAYNGAAGETREEIAATLGLGDLSTEQINESFAGLADVLTGADESVTMTIANSVWYTNRRTLVPQFGDICRTYYDARVSGLDFQQAGAAEEINNWISENTNGKIEKMVNPPLDPSLVCLLANAVYFKANWTNIFDPADTRPGIFNTSMNQQTTVDFMVLETSGFRNEDSLLDSNLTYLAKSGEFSAFSMPYGERQFRMTVFLPNYAVHVDEFISQFTAEKWLQWNSEFTSVEFIVYLPKFKFEYEVKLNEALSAMGMNMAFQSGAADFSSMIEGGGIWIDAVMHKTFVQVDEEGTEAAGATTVTFLDSGPPSVICNRPFVFIIWEKESNAVIFAGKVSRPVWND